MIRRNHHFILSLTLVLLASVPARVFHAVPAFQSIPDGMVLIERGEYVPLYNSPEGTGTEQVRSFFMDADPITNGEFLTFVIANPAWQRSRISTLFADRAYLRHWAGDAELGSEAMAEQPVTNVSWFSAKAYADWNGHRLPTVAEWEMVAAAGSDSPNGLSEPGFKAHLLELTNQPVHNPLPAVGGSEENYWGVRDMHGLVWEWISDFNSALITGESRADASLERKLYCGSGVVGASDFTDYAAFMRFAFRASLKAHFTVSNLGFRTVKDPAEAETS